MNPLLLRDWRQRQESGWRKRDHTALSSEDLSSGHVGHPKFQEGQTLQSGGTPLCWPLRNSGVSGAVGRQGPGPQGPWSPALVQTQGPAAQQFPGRIV